MSARGWSHVKVYIESPPVLWVLSEDAEDRALSVSAERLGGRWFYRVSRSMLYPCDAVQRVAAVLDDVLRDGWGCRGFAGRR
ncbi:hypothetical protein [Actinomadura formosensis]|uniref:hypothetical protein n=1 Tax=Actinomadura formosensis TaxID=60706 RepID=UPI003D8D5A15